MSSDVCKHCTHAGCLDACPTGALFRSEFGTVVVQQDICNGCGYCVPSCPYGVIDQRKGDGRVFKCTMCYDRLTDGLMPACATACPTQSIQFGDLDELQARADARLATLQSQGVETARLYGRDENDGVGGNGAFFLLLDEPEVYGLPPDPIVPGPRHARDVEVGHRGRGDDRRGGAVRRPRLAEALTMTEGVATPGAGWRRADGWVGKKKGGGKGRRSGRRAVGEVAMVDDVEFTSYYGRPIIKAPVWKSPDVPLYLFLGGAAGTSAILGAMADLSGRPALTRASRLVAGGGSIASVVFLVHDLGRPERFLHMLRVFKPTSALSVGTYILSPFSAAAGATAAVELLGWFPRLKRFGGIVSALFGGPMATYTAVLLANTAVPSWRAPHKQLPFVFAGSAMAAGGGLTMIFTPVAEAGPSRKMAVAGAAIELAVVHRVEHDHGIVSEPYHEGRPGHADAGGEGVHRCGRRADRGGRPHPARGGCVRNAAGGRLAADPLRGLRGRHGQRAGPEVHGDPAAGAHGRPRGRARPRAEWHDRPDAAYRRRR